MEFGNWKHLLVTFSSGAQVPSWLWHRWMPTFMLVFVHVPVRVFVCDPYMKPWCTKFMQKRNWSSFYKKLRQTYYQWIKQATWPRNKFGYRTPGYFFSFPCLTDFLWGRIRIEAIIWNLTLRLPYISENFYTNDLDVKQIRCESSVQLI